MTTAWNPQSPTSWGFVFWNRFIISLEQKSARSYHFKVTTIKGEPIPGCDSYFFADSPEQAKANAVQKARQDLENTVSFLRQIEDALK